MEFSYTDEDYIDILKDLDQSGLLTNRFESTFVHNLLELEETYGKLTLSEKQKQVILEMKERYGV